VLVTTVLSCEGACSWLLIVDNADDMDLLFGNTSLTAYLLFSRRGSILFTTWNHDVVVRLDISEVNAVVVEGMSKDKALKFLKTPRYGRSHLALVSFLQWVQVRLLALARGQRYLGPSVFFWISMCHHQP
jgi:hypothetical protein